MWPDRVSNPGPLTNESGALPTALRGPAFFYEEYISGMIMIDRKRYFYIFMVYEGHSK